MGTHDNLPQGKQTIPGLYLTAKEAYETWMAEPGKIKMIDVRTYEEYIFIGHAEMAWNIPFAFQSYEWDADKGMYRMKINTDFLSQVKEMAGLQDMLLLMCRSGSRSAMAVNMLAKAGYSNVYNIIDGMEGDLVKNPESVFVGQRLMNGWKNSGCPWTYKPNPARMLLPKTS